MSRPIFYYGNLLLSGTLSGTADSATNPVRRVRDGSIGFEHTPAQASSTLTVTGDIYVTLTASGTPAAWSFPRCLLTSGTAVQLHRMDDVAETGIALVDSFTVSAETTSVHRELTTSGALVWRVRVISPSGAEAGQDLHEVQLSSTKYQLPRSPSVGVTRTTIRQFDRVPLPGGEPFRARRGPPLRRVDYDFVILSGAELTNLHALVSGTDRSQAFVFTDDLGSTYWAELMGLTHLDADAAGVNTVALSVQEVRV